MTTQTLVFQTQKNVVVFIREKSAFVSFVLRYKSVGISITRYTKFCL
jgi:hypothetical protein